MIFVVSGKLGSGKSYDCVRMITEHLRRGGAVRTNISLSLPQLRVSLGRRLAPWQIGIVDVNSNPREIPTGDLRGRGNRRCLVVLDECLNWFASNPDPKKDTRKDVWGEWLRQSDKLGQDVYFIAQNFERAAKWIRELAHVSINIVPIGDIKFCNLIPLKYLFPPLRSCYFAVWRDLGSGCLLQTALHRRTSAIWRFYDTSETFGFVRPDSAYGEGLFPPFRLPWAFLLFPLLPVIVFLVHYFISRW